MTTEPDSRKLATKYSTFAGVDQELSGKFFHCQICSLCAEEPLWGKISLIGIEILKLLCYFYGQGLLTFSLSELKNEFAYFSTLVTEDIDEVIDQALELLLERNYLIKVPLNSPSDDTFVYALNSCALSSQLGKFDLECPFGRTKYRRRLDKYFEMISAGDIPDLRFQDQSSVLFNEVAICEDRRPLWQIISFIDNDIIRLFCQSFSKGIYEYTLPVFRKNFIPFSRSLERKVSKKSFEPVLYQLVKKGYLIKTPRYKLNGSFFRLIYDRSHVPNALEIVEQTLTKTGGVYGLHFEEESYSFTFYFNRAYYDILGDNLSSCPIWFNDYYEFTPYFPELTSDDGYPGLGDENLSTRVVDSQCVYALNLTLTHSLFFDIPKISQLSPIGLHHDCYRILSLLAAAYPKPLPKDQLGKRLGKCDRVVGDRLEEIEPFALVGKTTPLKEVKAHLSKDESNFPNWLRELISDHVVRKLVQKPRLLSNNKRDIKNKNKEHYYLNYGNFLNNNNGGLFNEQ